LTRRTHGDGGTLKSTRSKRTQMGDEEGSTTMIRNNSVVDNVRRANAASEARHATQTSAETALGDGASRQK
jgi:hypothetical protein